MRPRPWLLVASSLYALPLAAQNAPAESLRAGPTPPRVAEGEVIAFARSFSAQRRGEALMLAYTENGPAGRATLRGALLRRDGDALVRAREDVTLAPDARTIALAWGGDRAAVVYVVPRHPPPPAAPGAPARRRAPAVGVPPSTDDPLGPSNLTGGDLVVQRLDAEGRAQGAPVTLFTENARLTRVSAAWVGERLLVAWTGATVTDDEIRVTVRVRTILADGTMPRAVATHTGITGDIGDTLEIVPRDGGADVFVSAIHCGAEVPAGEALTPPEDPSRDIEAPRRVLMPQQPMRDAPGAAIGCGPLALHRVRLDSNDRVLERRTLAPLDADVAVRVHDRWWLPTLVDGRRLFAESRFDGDRFLVEGRAPDSATAAPMRAQDLSPRRRSEQDPTLQESPMEPAPGEGMAASAAAAGELVSVSSDRAALWAWSPGHVRTPPRVLARSAMRITELAALDGETPWILVREGLWSGPVRWLRLAEREPFAWPRATPVPVPQRPAPPNPYTWDEPFARLWVRARTARAIFMRHENSAGALAARPEAPTDPRMPGVIANRTRLRGRWESACGALQTRASQLIRRGAGPELQQAVSQLCEIHADLQLGVPINPAL